jgi:AraC-like DNA-binding protein
MSERSLRRVLESEGVRFRDLLDRARRQHAERLMARGGRSLSVIALSCGYADVSAFSHACRRWFGASPRSRAGRELDVGAAAGADGAQQSS